MKIKSDTLLLSSREMAGLLKKSCEKGISFKFTVQGMSMSPFICGGDAVIIEPASHRKVEIGDIVAFICPENDILIIHRVVTRRKDKYLLKGDNVFHHDGWIEKDDIHGYLKNIIVLGGKNHGIYLSLRQFFLFINKFKNTNAVLSRYWILTVFCRIINKLF